MRSEQRHSKCTSLRLTSHSSFLFSSVETNGAVTRTPFAHYEVEVASNTVTRYYYFGGQMIAMRQGSAQPTYLHTDALGSSVLRDVSLATIPATGPVGMVGAATGNFAATGATVAGRFRTIDLAFHGNASALDLVVSETTFYVGAQGNLPFASEVASLTQLIYDLADPIIPDDIR